MLLKDHVLIYPAPQPYTLHKHTRTHAHTRAHVHERRETDNTHTQNK